MWSYATDDTAPQRDRDAPMNSFSFIPVVLALAISCNQPMQSNARHIWQPSHSGYLLCGRAMLCQGISPFASENDTVGFELPIRNRGSRPIWIADAHRDHGKRFVVGADEKLTHFGTAKGDT
jgi:hypothetical protein